MAFEFLGTFTQSQFKRFSAFVQAQQVQITARIQHLNAEINRIGGLAFAFDQGGIPTAMSPADNITYIGKLFQAYEALGGDAFYDLQTRAMTQAVYRLTGSEGAGESQMMSNGEVVGTPGLSDAETAELMRQARDWTYDAQFYRRDLLERKIRRMLDYADQLQAEVNLLQQLQSSAQVEGSLAFILAAIQSFIDDRQYLAAQKDNGDPNAQHGKFAYSPIAAYMPGPKGAPTDSFERTYDGAVVPGEGSG